MAESVITNQAKMKLVQARAGLLGKLPKIVGMAFGDGAASGSNIRVPLETDTKLQNELHRQEVDSVTLQDDNISVIYKCTLAKDVLSGKVINEVALYDEDGDLVAIKSFSDKGKDEDMEMTFVIKDTF